MRQVILSIPDNNYTFFIELAKSLQFVKKIEEIEPDTPPTKQEVLDSITEGINQARQHQKGKIKLQTAEQLLSEL